MKFTPLILTPLLLIAACATVPTGPTVQVLPGNAAIPSGRGHRATVKTLEQFTGEQELCKHRAAAEVSGDIAHDNWMQALPAVGGMLGGAGLGAAIGGGRGAAIGAAGGALAGGTYSGVASSGKQQTLQEKYNISFVSCMATYGNHASSAEARR